VTVSRRQLLLRISGDSVTVTDLGSHNGTWINRMKMRPGTPVSITPRDRIYLPALVLRLVVIDGRTSEPPAQPEPAIEASATTAEQPLSRCPPAGSPRRIAATLVDMVLFAVLSFFVMLPILLSTPSGAGRILTLERLAAIAGDTSWLHLAVATLLAWIVLWWAYFIIGWGVLGATPGQRLFHLRVVDHRGRYPIGPARAALRLIAYSVGSLPLCAGHLLVCFRSDCRSLHDVLAGTQVIRIPCVAAPADLAREQDGLGDESMARKSFGTSFLVVGVLVFLVALSADTLGIGRNPGLGRWQILGAVIGVVIAALGMIRLRR